MNASRLQTVRQRISEGIVAWERREYEEALGVFRSLVEEHPEFADVHNRAGLCLAMLDRPDEALVAFERALELNPSYAEAHLNRGIVLTELARHDEAQSAFDEASRLDTRDGLAFPSSVGNQLAVTHGRLGDLYRVAARQDLAVEQYRAALEIRPRYLDIRARLAEVLVELGRSEEARDELEWVLQENPAYTEARIRLGVVLHHVGETDAAIDQWMRCLNEDPDDLRPRAYLVSVGARPADRSAARDGKPKA
jgi:tetratricopeptide (TPR) repeat protein